MRPAVAAIAVQVLDYFGFESSDVAIMLSKDRHGTMVAARQVTIWLVRERMRLSYPELGREFGGRDHSTMISSVRYVADVRQSRTHKEIAQAAIAVFRALPGVEHRHAGVVSTSGSREIDFDLAGGAE
jgi:chromosomal replication initiator protein